MASKFSSDNHPSKKSSILLTSEHINLQIKGIWVPHDNTSSMFCSFKKKSFCAPLTRSLKTPLPLPLNGWIVLILQLSIWMLAAHRGLLQQPDVPQAPDVDYFSSESPVPSFRSMYQSYVFLSWDLLTVCLAGHTITVEGLDLSALFPTVYSTSGSMISTTEYTSIFLEWLTEWVCKWCWGLDWKTGLPSGRNQGSLEKWWILGLGQAIHRSARKYRNTQKPKGRGVLKGHRSQPKKNTQWPNLKQSEPNYQMINQIFKYTWESIPM